uniref:Uncharacterized protein n=1 Tax=Anopheles farauti TaxID=69004 RepID=A0A182QM57_9DIPT
MEKRVSRAHDRCRSPNPGVKPCRDNERRNRNGQAVVTVVLAIKCDEDPFHLICKVRNQFAPIGASSRPGRDECREEDVEFWGQGACNMCIRAVVVTVTVVVVVVVVGVHT